jgi:hypothetical protein
LDTYSDKVIGLFRDRALAGESVDVQDVFGRFTLDAAGEFLFGTTELNTLDFPLPKPGKALLGQKGSLHEGEYGGFANAVKELQEVMNTRAMRPWIWPLYELFGDATNPPNEMIDDWVSNFLKHPISLYLIRVVSIM